MPKILDRLVRQLEAKGKSKKSSYAIAVSALQKSGNLEKGSTKATKKGLKRGEMTPAERAKDRARKEGRKGKLVYNSKTNTVRKAK